jgi:ABC-2 type transport system permease protein
MNRLYLRLIGASIRAQMQYKLHFLTTVATTGIIMVLDFLVLSAILLRFDHVNGWNLHEVGVLYAISSAAVSLYRLFAPELHEFERYVQQGEFDQLLIRPLSPLALLLTRNLELGRIGGIVQGLAVFVVAVVGLHAQGKPAWEVVLYAPVALLSGSAIFFALSLATATLCFWTHQTKDLQTFTIYAPANASNYPVSLYPGWLKGLFFSVIPIAFVNYVPMLYLLGKGGDWYYPILTPLVAAASVFVALRFWNRGIRAYHSTGS